MKRRTVRVDTFSRSAVSATVRNVCSSLDRCSSVIGEGFRLRFLLGCLTRHRNEFPCRHARQKSREGIVKLTDCRLFSAFLHEAKPLKSRRAAIDNLPKFRSESG